MAKRICTKYDRRNFYCKVLNSGFLSEEGVSNKIPADLRAIVEEFEAKYGNGIAEHSSNLSSE